MANIIAAFTIFTFLLFAVTTATIASDQAVLSDSDSVFKSELVTVSDPDAVIPVEKPKSALDETPGNDQLPESEKTQTFHVRPILPTERMVFPKAYPIQRHSFDRSTRIPLRFVRRHPCRKFKKMFVIPTKVSYGNDMMLSDKTATLDLESIGDQVPTKWLEFKHKYGHRHHHDKDEKFEMKYEFNEEKHKEKKREHKGGFMRRVRKFLKHTFD